MTLNFRRPDEAMWEHTGIHSESFGDAIEYSCWFNIPSPRQLKPWFLIHVEMEYEFKLIWGK